MKRSLILLLTCIFSAAAAGVEFEGKRGPGKGKRVVLVGGDEEYRSEEMLPQMARILSGKHGFRCTVLFAVDPADGTVNPNRNDNIPGLESLDRADLMVLFTRWRDLPDEQTRHIERYIASGRPIVAIRTATHPFNFKTSKTYARWNSDSREWDGGFGRQLLGETWMTHHGQHGKQSTRAVVVPGRKGHPILRGVSDIWVPTDVYGVREPFPPENETLLLGQILTGMSPSDPPLEGVRNNPMMPVAWTRTYTYLGSKPGRVFTTTMGSAQDFASPGFRRLIVNAVYWATGMEKKIDADSDVAIVEPYNPSPFRFNGFIKGRMPTQF